MITTTVPSESLKPALFPGRRFVAGSRRGMNLVELVLACAVLSMAMLGTTKLLMAVIVNNRSTALEIAASTSIRNMVEEILTVARDDPTGVGNSTGAVLLYFSTRAGAVVAPDRITYTFPVAQSGVLARNNAGAMIGARDGVGTAVFYLRETEVPAVSDDFTTEGVNDYVWRDISTNLTPAAIAGDPALRPVARGFDMNLDGAISDVDSLGARRYQVLTLDALRASTFDMFQLPVDLTVIYYSDDTQTRADCTVKRRLVVTREGSQQSTSGGFGFIPPAAQQPGPI